MNAVIAIDIGTSSARAALVDQNLKVHAMNSRPYGLSTPRPGYAEQDAEAVFASLCEAISECLESRPSGLRITGITLDTAMHSFLALDERDEPLTQLWTFADVRSAGIVHELAQDQQAAKSLYLRTGCPPHPMYFPPKAIWLQENDPETFKKAVMFTTIKGYTLFKLTGRHVDDLAIASAGGLLNLHQLDWDSEALSLAGLSRERLPALVEPRSVVGTLVPELAERWQLEPIPVVAGGSDGTLANVGAGCIQRGDMAITVGTSSAVRMFATSPQVDDAMRTWCYYLGDRTWVVGGAISAGASTLTWLRETLPGLVSGSSNPHEQLDQMAQSIDPGSDGLLFAPYLTGERNPGLQGDARGYMAGLSLHHTARHLVRATMEGVAYQIAWVYESVAELAGNPGTIRLTGGFVGSAIWPQILADVLGQRLEVPAEKEGSLIGAAAFGLSALDSKIDWRDLVREIPVEQVISPSPGNHHRYVQCFETYKRLYGAIRPHFREVFSLQES